MLIGRHSCSARRDQNLGGSIGTLEGNNARPTVAFIGAGIGGVYLVAMLGLIGCKVRLHDIDDSRLKDLREAKGIQVEGLNGGFAPLDMAATDLKASTDGADIGGRNSRAFG
jgi:threonine dehydrogenase-like Zn-dependent dehydrogenase